VIWAGKQLDTIGDLSEAVLAITRAGDRDAAQRFMQEYRAETPHADANIGYLSGYYDPPRMAEVQDLFGVAHPLFGQRKDVTPEEALEAGGRMARGEARS
jgi:hypothetical protein